MLKNKRTTSICITYKGKKIRIKPLGIENLSKYGLNEKDEAIIIAAHSSIVERWAPTDKQLKTAPKIESKAEPKKESIVNNVKDLINEFISIEPVIEVIPSNNKEEKKEKKSKTKKASKNKKRGKKMIIESNKEGKNSSKNKNDGLIQDKELLKEAKEKEERKKSSKKKINEQTETTEK